MRSYEGEDDGGIFQYQEEKFDGIVFTFGRDESLDGIRVTSPKYQMPSGVHVGMSIDEVSRLLRFSLAGVPVNSVIALSPCDSYEDAKMTLSFGDDEKTRQSGMLKVIEIYITYD